MNSSSVIFLLLYSYDKISSILWHVGYIIMFIIIIEIINVKTKYKAIRDKIIINIVLSTIAIPLYLLNLNNKALLK